MCRGGKLSSFEAFFLSSTNKLYSNVLVKYQKEEEGRTRSFLQGEISSTEVGRGFHIETCFNARE